LTPGLAVDRFKFGTFGLLRFDIGCDKRFVGFGFTGESLERSMLVEQEKNSRLESGQIRSQIGGRKGVKDRGQEVSVKKIKVDIGG